VTYEELLADIASKNYRESRTLETPYAALNAVVEIHQPYEDPWFGNGTCCRECTREEYTAKYPCDTIQAIEKELV
jgi:hypothetical protein